jgi:hypothetical protein
VEIPTDIEVVVVTVEIDVHTNIEKSDRSWERTRNEKQ